MQVLFLFIFIQGICKGTKSTVCCYSANIPLCILRPGGCPREGTKATWAGALFFFFFLFSFSFFFSLLFFSFPSDPAVCLQIRFCWRFQSLAKFGKETIIQRFENSKRRFEALINRILRRLIFHKLKKKINK